MNTSKKKKSDQKRRRVMQRCYEELRELLPMVLDPRLCRGEVLRFTVEYIQELQNNNRELKAQTRKYCEIIHKEKEEDEKMAQQEINKRQLERGHLQDTEIERRSGSNEQIANSGSLPYPTPYSINYQYHSVRHPKPIPTDEWRRIYYNHPRMHRSYSQK
eukprot:Nk52_evm68s212 gene=Nk52_evmTU68s212